jgi:UDP-glucose 4-epimerase
MNVYITGVAGFLGSEVARQFIDLGWTVVGCDNMITGRIENIPDGAVFIRKDVRELEAIPDNTTVVIHTAAIARSAWPDADEMYDVNVIGTQAVLTAAKNVGARVVHASSCVALLPWTNRYASSKYVAERAAVTAGATALRYSNIYGPGQSEDGPEPNVLANWLRQLGDHEAIRVDGDGRQTRDFIHVKDAARATVMAALRPVGDHQWMDICTGVQTPIIELAHKFSPNIRFADRRPGDPDCLPQDPGYATALLGFTAEIPLEQGLKDIL